MAANKDRTAKIIGLLLGLLFLLKNTKLFARGNRLFGSEIENISDLEAFALEVKRQGQILESKARGLALYLAPGQIFYYFEEMENGAAKSRSEIRAVPGSGEFFTVAKVIFSPAGALLVYGAPQLVVDAGGLDFKLVPGYALEAAQSQFITKL